MKPDFIQEIIYENLEYEFEEILRAIAKLFCFKENVALTANLIIKPPQK